MAAGSQTVSQINSGLMKICTADQVRKETQLMMKSYANWEEFLMPGPISIAILSELIFISSADDFPLNKGTPEKPLQFIKHPESFRACMMQVCNEGWTAFNTANKNMDQIRLYSLNIPEDIKMVVKTLMQENPTIVEALLPVQLNKIKTVSNECLRLAACVERNYLNVIDLISEILEICTVAKSTYKESLKEAERAIQEANIRKKSAETAQKLAAEHYSNMTNQLNESQEAYKEAMLSLPSGWDMIGLSLVESLRDSIACIPQTIKNIFSQSNSATGDVPEVVGAMDCKQERVDVGATNNILSKSLQLLEASLTLNVFVFDECINMKELRDQKTGKAKSSFTKATFNRIKKEVERENKCTARTAVLNICKEGISICDKLQNLVDSANPDLKSLKSLASKIKQFHVKVQELHAGSNMLINTSAFKCKAPHSTKAGNKLSAPASVLESSINMAHFKVEQTKSQLQNTRDEYKHSFANMKQCNEELDEILIMMGKCDVQKVDFEKTLQILVKGLGALGRVREQWTKMVQFFQMISNLISTCLCQCLGRFVEECKNIPAIPGYSHDSFIKDMIYNQAFQASNVANIVHMISETYVDVSRKHLMDQVSSLGTLMSLDPSDREFKKIRSKMQNSCKDARFAIQRLVCQNKEQFEDRIKQRIDTINDNLKAVLPTASEEQMQAIQGSFQKEPMKIIEELSQEDADQFA